MFYNPFTSTFAGFSTFVGLRNGLGSLNQTIMKHVKHLLIFAFLFVSVLSFGQNLFTDCTAAFLDNKMVVNAYTPKGKCSLQSSATGKLTVCTAELGASESKALEKILFRIAIRDKKTKTLVMYSDEAYKQIDVQTVLQKCSQGDYIVLMTIDTRYALPHNEILVM